MYEVYEVYEGGGGGMKSNRDCWYVRGRHADATRCTRRAGQSSDMAFHCANHPSMRSQVTVSMAMAGQRNTHANRDRETRYIVKRMHGDNTCLDGTPDRVEQE